MGKGVGALVFILDLLKVVVSYVAICMVAWLFKENMSPSIKTLYMLASVVGHSYPLYYGFKGGKAVLAFLSGVWFVDWRAALICFGIFVILLFTVRFMSVASMSFAVLFPVALFILGCREGVALAAMAVAGILVVVRHHANIKRLISGTESKFSLRSKK